MNKNEKILNTTLINFMKNNSENWAIKDEQSRYIFINNSALTYYNIPLDFDYYGCTDTDLPHPGAELAAQFRINDKKILNDGISMVEVETHIYGKNRRLEPHLCEKSPLLDHDGNCIGIVCRGQTIRNGFYLHHLLLNNNKDTHFSGDHPFSEKELNVIYFLLQGCSSKETAKKLALSHRTIESRLQNIYQKLNINCSAQLKQYCISCGLNNYLPENLIRPGVVVVKKGHI